MEPGILAKVLHNFLTTVEGELSLVKDEHFIVHSVIDKHWVYGESNGKWGKFPTSHLVRINIPEIQQNESLFVTIAKYSGTDPGQITFGLGELIVGMHSINENWYFGRSEVRTGIFPVSHTWKLNTSFLKSSTKSVWKKAKVKMSMKAQLDEEIDLLEGEEVTVVEIMDDGWCWGITEDGRKGTFPETFITYLNDFDETDKVFIPNTLEADESSHSNYDENFPESVFRGSGFYKDFGESAQKEENSHNYVASYDDPAPDYYDLYPTLRANSTEPQDDDTPHPLGTKPYAITLFQFNAQYPNELSFKPGEIVNLIKYINKEWIEGSIDDKKGIFPATYVNVIVDCIQPIDNLFAPETHSLDANNHNENTILESGTKMKVEYSYQAQMDGDLSVNEGEIVSVVEMTNQDWITVENEKKETGLCPRTYLAEVNSVDEDFYHDALEDFVVLRKPVAEYEETEKREEKAVKRLSEPHRPAPPAPSPSRVPLKVHQSRTDEVEGSAVFDERQKRADKRQNVISELVLTEKAYVKDLKLTYETFHLYNPSLLESQGIDVGILFGNLEEVMNVAEELLDKILRAMKGCDEEYQTIGPCFLKTADKMLHVYRKYCGNHAASLELLEKYEDKKEMVVLNAGTDDLKRKIACFDMSSILIKPVQRILKYPLMLHELIKCTEDDHPDKPELEEAWRAMTDVATNINEYKRRKDVISKILDSDNTLMSRMARLNMHSVAKKSTRLSAKLSASLGLMALTSDPQFEEYERQFKVLEKCAKDLAKDASQCKSHLREKSKCGEELAELVKEFYDGTPSNEVATLKSVRRIIETKHIPQLVRQMDELVLSPINSLIIALQGPDVLIQKRNDKLIDYNSAIIKSEKYKDNAAIREELETTRNNFEILNKHLLEELPILIDASTRIICECVKTFTSLRKLLSGKVLKHYLDLVESSEITPQKISKEFSIDFNLSYNKVSSSNNSEQSEVIQRMLKNKYCKDDLFEVTETHSITVPINRTIVKGTIVGLKKKNDPLGDESNWIVDNGEDIIIVSNNYLKPWKRNEVNQTATNAPDLMVLESPKEEVKQSTSNFQLLCHQNLDNTNDKISSERTDQGAQSQHYQNITPQFYYAMHDFHHQIPGTLKVDEGQALKLITPHDLKGNSEWYLVENRNGETGYVPKTYLKPCS